MWTERDDNHGWDTVFNIFDCFAMILMIWVFDGIRTICKDKDIGSLMVGCMELATVLNVVTTLIESGLFSMAKFILSKSIDELSWSDWKSHICSVGKVSSGYSRLMTL